MSDAPKAGEDRVEAAWSSSARQVLRRLWRNRLAMTGFALLLLVLVAAVFADALSAHDPLTMTVSDRMKPPSPHHVMGTDNFGRDIFSRVLHGARLSLEVGAAVMVLTVAAGVLFGLLSGYFPRLDGPIMRVMDAMMAFPAILFGIAIMAVLGPKTFNVVIALSVVYAPRTVRIVRASVLATKQLDYVEAVRAQAAGHLRILFRHILPNCMSPLVVQATFNFAYAVLAEASLSFVGAGAPPPTPSWGNILSEGRIYMQNAPWITIFPGVAIAVTVLGLNLAGDGLRDVLDPRMKT
ncbi:MAG: peptide ABC transporter permease [candidate division NC10 bacterium RBG_16_65_8]|nr:MAG: peptide ABC transporter permease [candidate division NC10 bacterium RBG_16_65_8]